MLEMLKLTKSYVQKGWCKDYYAKDKNDKDVDPGSKKACKWCILGALFRSAAELKESNSDVKKYLLRYTLGQSLAGFNDTHVKKDIIKLLNVAIRDAKNNT